MSDSKNVTPGWFDIVAMVVLAFLLFMTIAGAEGIDRRVDLKSYPVYSEKRVRCKMVKEPRANSFSMSCASNQTGIVYLDPNVFDLLPMTVKIYQRPRPKPKPEIMEMEPRESLRKWARL